MKNHTGIAEGIDNLVGLLLVVEVPGLLEGAHRGLLSLGAVLLLAELQAIEYEDTADSKVLEFLELLLDVVLQSEWEATQRTQKRLAGCMVNEVLGDIEGGVDTDDRALQSGEGKGLGAAIDPFIECAD